MKRGWWEADVRLNAMQTHMIALQQDVHGIYTISARHDARPDRIERPLKLVEAV
jgi:hypothetical protein